MHIVILAAGLGSRLGSEEVPKPLTRLDTGQTILDYQLKELGKAFPDSSITAVVGYKKEAIKSKYPSLHCVDNDAYRVENNSKSLLKGISNIDDDILWINGDVLFNPKVLLSLRDNKASAIVVNHAAVGDEEMKYSLNSYGTVTEISKTVPKPQGESVGIHYVSKEDIPILKSHLQSCDAGEYFEKAIDNAIKSGWQIRALLIDTDDCLEIDFPDDLRRANAMLTRWRQD